jgi:PPOX class probable F420-dependent enzyme
MLDANVHKLACARSTVYLATLMADTGEPQTSMVWAHADEQHILIGTNKARQKYRNVLADPRVSVLILDPDDARRYVEIRGQVTHIETGEPALELVRTTFGKWTGAPAPFDVEADRVLLKIAPERIRWKVARS